MFWGKYFIEKLPVNSIIVPIEKPTKREREYMQILNLASVGCPLRIRPNAAEFVKRFGDLQKLPIYAVIYQDDEFTECLYFFTYQPYENGNTVLHITRCIGKNLINRHKYGVRGFIDRHEKEIRALSDSKILEFK